MACVMQGIRLTIIVVSTKSHIRQYFSVICLDLPCSELEQLLFLNDLGVEEETLVEKCAQFIYYS